jgi:hypothetical protein
MWLFKWIQTIERHCKTLAQFASEIELHDYEFTKYISNHILFFSANIFKKLSE